MYWARIVEEEGDLRKRILGIEIGSVIRTL